MSNQCVLFSSDEGVCMYNSNETKDSFEFLYAPSMEDIASELKEYYHVTEASLPDFLDNDQCFETLDYVYLKTDNQFYKLSKRNLFIDSLNLLIDGIDELLRVAGFVKMTSRQRICLERILTHILSRSISVGPTLLLPIVSEIDYLNHSDYDSDDIPWKIEISTSSPLWIEAAGKINCNSVHPISLQYSYSYLCKTLLFR